MSREYIFAIYDSYDELCPDCGKAIDMNESLPDNSYVCLHCGSQRDVSDAIPPYPHTVFPMPENVAPAIFVWIAEHIKPGHWIELIHGYMHVTCVETGTAVNAELYAKIMGGECQ